MYAIIRTGGKQYRVEVGQTLRVAKVNQKVNSELTLSDVLYVKGHVGTPYVAGAKVTAIVKREGKEKKVLVFKKKRRKGYRKLQGHRQDFVELVIQSIHTPDGKKVTAKVEQSKSASKKVALKKKKTKVASSSIQKKKGVQDLKKQKAKKKTKKTGVKKKTKTRTKKKAKKST